MVGSRRNKTPPIANGSNHGRCLSDRDRTSWASLFLLCALRSAWVLAPGDQPATAIRTRGGLPTPRACHHQGPDGPLGRSPTVPVQRKPHALNRAGAACNGALRGEVPRFDSIMSMVAWGWATLSDAKALGRGRKCRAPCHQGSGVKSTDGRPARVERLLHRV